jgi:cytochrome c peroxidase
MKFLLLLTMTSLLASCSFKKEITQADKDLHAKAKGFFEPIPETLVDKQKFAKKIELGEKLYFEKKLSINNTISCNSCHMLDKFGVDNEPTSPGHDGTRGDRNSPTSYNAALHFRQFWDGRAKDVEEQALGPILNPIEHGLKNEKEALAKINTPEYIEMFKNAFPGEKNPFTYKNVGNAIGAFERTLMTPSRFDDYLKGDIHALDADERAGLDKFITVGCTQCHNGVAMGGNSYQKLGVVKKYPTKDTGRHHVTKKRRDKFKFKTPGLRNIEKTGPYFHDGSVKTLQEAIDVMAEYQLGKKLTTEEIKSIQAFLSSLTAKDLPY